MSRTPTKEQRNLIYAARDPVTNELRYVGQTRKGLKDREQRHRGEAFKCTDHAHHWMRSLLEKNLWPRFEILETFDDSDDVQKILDEAEIRWIAEFRAAGHPLTNTAPGGQRVGSGP